MSHRGGAGYLTALRTPGAAAFSGAGAVARLPQAMLGLASVLLLLGLGRSYAVGGSVAGAIALSQAAAAPWLSRAIDRLGQRRVVAPQLVVHLCAVCLLLLGCESGSPAWLLVANGAVVGATLPQAGALARSRWTALLAGGDPRLATGLAIETLVEESVFVLGPVIVTVLVTGVDRAAGLVAALVLEAVGCSALLAQSGTEPRVVPASAERPPAVLASRGLVGLIATFLVIGVSFGLVEVAVIAVCREQHRPGATGLLLGLWALGSVACGTWYGSRRWTSPPRRRLLVGAIGMACGSVLIAATGFGVPSVLAGLVIAGAANAPTLITGNTLVPAVVDERGRTEAYTWLTVAVFAGIAVGSPLAGVIVDAASGRAALWAAVVAGVAIPLVVAASQRHLPDQGS